MQLYYLDGAKKLREALDGEPMLPLTEWIADQAKEQDVHGTWRVSDACIRTNAGSIELKLTPQLACEKDAFRARFMADIKDRRIDVVLCPAGPGPAPLHGTSKYWGYTSLFNLLDWPAAVFPTGISVNASHQEDGNYKPRNEHEEFIYSLCKSSGHCLGGSSLITLTDSPDKFVNAPIGLQLAAPRWQDERLMAALQIICEVLPLH